jgi:hypothetical protein
LVVERGVGVLRGEDAYLWFEQRMVGSESGGVIDILHGCQGLFGCGLTKDRACEI